MPNPAIIAAASLFPFDPKMDTPLGHRNLIAVYVVIWVSQSLYALHAFNKYRASRKKNVIARGQF